MGRSKKKTTRLLKKYSSEQLTHAIQAVKDGSTQFAAAKKYAIPRSTLFNMISGKSVIGKKPGPDTVLSTVEEKVIEKWILNLAVRGFPVKKQQLLHSIQMYLNTMKRNTPFVDNFPGRKWYTSFLARHPIIAERVSQNLTPNRAAITREQIKRWHDEVRKYCEDNDLLEALHDPSRVFNMDEKGFVLTPKSVVLARRGEKAVYNRSKNDEKECVTALLGGNAAGKPTPPMIVLPCKRMPSNVLLSSPAKWSVGISDSGRQTQVTFYDYMSQVFHKWLLEEKIALPVIVFIDGHKSHISLTLSEFCAANEIQLVALFPNSTHITQPMDVGVFKPLNGSWTTKVTAWKLKHEYAKIEKKDVAPILNDAVEATDYASHLKQGFRRCGLYPFNYDSIDFARLLPATTDSVNSQDQLWNETESVESNTVLASSQNEASDDLRQLNQFEALIDYSILNLFRQSKDNNWSGPTEYKALFAIWNKMSSKITSIPDHDGSTMTVNFHASDAQMKATNDCTDCSSADTQMEATNGNTDCRSMILAVRSMNPQVPIELTNDEIAQCSIISGDDTSTWMLGEDGQLLCFEEANSTILSFEQTTKSISRESDDAATKPSPVDISDPIDSSNGNDDLHDDLPLDLSMPRENSQTFLSPSSPINKFDSGAFENSFVWSAVIKPKQKKGKLPEEKRSTVITSADWIRNEKKKMDDQLLEEN